MTLQTSSKDFIYTKTAIKKVAISPKQRTVNSAFKSRSPPNYERANKYVKVYTES